MKTKIKEFKQLQTFYKIYYASNKASDFARWLTSKNINLLVTLNKN